MSRTEKEIDQSDYTEWGLPEQKALERLGDDSSQNIPLENFIGWLDQTERSDNHNQSHLPEDKMNGIPATIYLQLGEQNDGITEFSDLDLGEVTWCVDRIEESDIEYTRSLSRETLEHLVFSTYWIGKIPEKEGATILGYDPDIFQEKYRNWKKSNILQPPHR